MSSVVFGACHVVTASKTVEVFAGVGIAYCVRVRSLAFIKQKKEACLLGFFIPLVRCVFSADWTESYSRVGCILIFLSREKSSTPSAVHLSLNCT